MSNRLELGPKHFSRGGEKFSRGASPSLVTGLYVFFPIENLEFCARVGIFLDVRDAEWDTA